MHTKTQILILLTILLLVPIARAADFTEDFESYLIGGFDPELKPDQDWYDYKEGADIGNTTDTPPIIEGTQSFRIVSPITEDITNRYAQFQLDFPIQLTSLNFTVEGATITDNGVGSQQYVSIESGFPIRKIVEFYLFCRNDTGNTSFDDGCQLKVRWQQEESTGVELVPYNATDQRFTILITPDWATSEFCLSVDGVNDGCFPFLELPRNIGRLQFKQYRTDFPLNITIDWFNVTGASNATSSTVEGDAAEGLKGFATTLHFTTSTSLFIFGLVIFILIMTALLMAMFSYGKSNTLAPSGSFFMMILIFWLVQMEFWPDWISITSIIMVSSLIGLVLRRVMLGIRDASTGPSLVIGCLGYFIICATLLFLAGYQQTQIFLPTGSPEEDGASSQTFVGAVAECTGAILTLGLTDMDCDQSTTSTTWKTITDIFGWIQAAFEYLFQLLTFQLPIPVFMNVMIVAPPAGALVAYAFEVIRG